MRDAHEDGTDTVFRKSAIKHHTPENNPKDYTRHSEHSESLKSRSIVYLQVFYTLDQSDITSKTTSSPFLTADLLTTVYNQF
jgi:hypothetical protein